MNYLRGVSKIAQEKTFEQKIKNFLKSKGCWHVKYFANRMTKSGIPDILACVNGYFLAIEVKAARGKPSELQLWNREQIRKSNGIAIVLYPDQFEDFKKLVEKLMHRDGRSEWEQYNFDRG